MWTSLGLLVTLAVAMSVLGTSYYANIRRAVGLPFYGIKADPLPEPVSTEALDTMLTSWRPWLLIAIGVGGLLIILWLIMLKPF